MIPRERWARLKPLLERAMHLTPEDIPAYLDQACRGDRELREAAERILRAREQARGSLDFLDSPAAELMAPLLELDPLPLASPDVLEPGVALGPYNIEQRIGAGGMGVVYLARDPRLDRKVALKLLPPWLAADGAAARRFAQEAIAASQLDHPNIQTVYEIGEAPDGRLYIAMAYYDGETLRERIARGPLAIDSTVDLARQIAEGLAAAHAQEIVHRDIKPSNVIVTPEGVAKIVDFGAAKIAGHGLTVSGATLGTVAYMSPEQTRHDDVDGRTDIWALGVVTYEMLTGRRPFAAQLSDAVIYAIRHDQPEPLMQLRPDAPERLAGVVHRCLEKDPRARYRDATSLATALAPIAGAGAGAGAGSANRRPKNRRLALLGAAGLIAVLAAASALLWPRIRSEDASPASASEAALPTPMRLAVVPLASSGPDAEDAYLVDGLVEELISRLSQLQGLRVLASSSLTPYRDTDKSLPEIGRELGVANLLAADIRKSDEQVRISVQLLDATSEEQLWAEDYDADIANVPTALRDIVDQVVAALGVRTRASERRQLAKLGTDNAEAHTEYLKGRYFLEKLETPGATAVARKHFERALDLDPTFAAAHAGLSSTYHQLAVQSLLPTSEALPRARKAAEDALQLDPELAAGHSCLAAALSWYYGDMEGAERHFRRAIELAPSYARAYRSLAVHLRNLGRFEEALTMVRRAGELDPLSPGAYNQEGAILYMSHRYEEAIAKFQQLLRVDPRYTPAYFYMALTYAQMGRYEEALAALQETDPQASHPDALTVRGYVLARLGQQEDARRILARLGELSASRPVSTFPDAVIRVGLGEYDRALGLLERAVEERAWQVRLLKVEPIFDPLRSDPRFRTLLEELHLTD
jgi:TolB-like protein/Tfp pilus assembly protein PilF